MKSCHQEPILGSAGTDHFAWEVLQFIEILPPGTHSRFHWNRPFCLRGVAICWNSAMRNPLSVPLEPTVLLERCCNLLKFCHEEPTLGSTGTDRFAWEVLQFSEILLSGTHSRFHWNRPFRLRGVAIYWNSCHQEPTLGSTGTDRFEQHSHKFVNFYSIPRALFIILNKARGTPRSDPPLEF